MRKHASLILLSCFLSFSFFISACAQTAQTGGNWGYGPENGPDRWAELDPAYHMCKEGKNQTPIDIVVDFDVDLPRLTLDYHPQSASVVNNGHTVQVDLAAGGDMLVGGKTFALQQAHFHAPGENHINGAAYPFEAHFVHKTPAGEIAVLAVMFSLGKENDGIAAIWKNTPKETNRPAPLGAVFAISSILPGNTDYIYFNGSLTTPPCSEGVRWYILKEALTISPEQVRIFSESFMGHTNNRTLQPANARVVLD